MILWLPMQLSEAQLWINLAVFLLGVSAFISWSLRGLFDAPRWGYWKRFLYVGLPVSVCLYLVTAFTAPAVDAILKRSDAIIKSIAGRATVAVCVVGAGMAAFWFKKRNKLRYGQAELAFGALSALGVAGSMTPNKPQFSQWMALMGAAYVVVRGLTNWSEALEKDPKRYGARNISEQVTGWIFIKDPSTSTK